jgi:beta-lactamase regulating signal transducer with metallopeptidase domain
MNDGLTTANRTNVVPSVAEANSVLNTPFVNYTKHPYESIKYMDPVNLIIVIVTYSIGILGNFAALVHLCRQRSYRNKKHSLMLKYV